MRGRSVNCFTAMPCGYRLLYRTRQAGWVGNNHKAKPSAFPRGPFCQMEEKFPNIYLLDGFGPLLRSGFCVQNPSKLGWVLPVTYKYVCPQTEEKQSQKTTSGAEVMSGQLTLKASLDVTSPGSLPCDYVVLCNISIITHLTTYLFAYFCFCPLG